MNRRLNFQLRSKPSFFAKPMDNGSQERRKVKILKFNESGSPSHNPRNCVVELNF
jgi:hypothetical protein